MSNKTFRKLPIVTFDNTHCDETCPQLKGFATKCKIDDSVLTVEIVVLGSDKVINMFLRTEECKREEKKYREIIDFDPTFIG